MRLKYHKQIVDMLYNEWDLGKTASKAKGKTCAWIYWFEILEETEQFVIKKCNKKLVGICGYAKRNSKKHFFRKKFYGTLKKILMCSPSIKNKSNLKKYCNAYDYLPKELENYFDGEIIILIVDKNFRGKSIGKELLLKIFDLANKDNMKNIQILADESCNYKFYESLDCKKIYETIVLNGEVDSEKGFVYEKKLR